jgi:brefeldin A-inhibited guanine nucleotide-exchange protein
LINVHNRLCNCPWWDLMVCVRNAQVTDTTTFTDEARRAEVDAWLYDTCTQCLQHMVDLVVQFYPVVQTLLPRILDLLDNFIR